MVNALGVDVGGSKTSAILVDASAPARPLAQVSVGSANYQSVGAQGAAAAVAQLVRELGLASGEAGIDAVFVGAAGADTPASQERMRRLFVDALPATPPGRVVAAHDTAILLAAGGAESGCVLICGTGSAAWARNTDGREARAGGWGPSLGDEGSGFGIARSALRATLDDADAGRPPSALARAAMDFAGVDEPSALLDAFYSDPERARWARLAGVVVEMAERDDDAASLLAGHLDALALLVERCCERTGVRGPVILAGGLAMNLPPISAGLSDRIRALGLDDVRVLDRDPVWGAVELASQLVALQRRFRRNLRAGPSGRGRRSPPPPGLR